MIMLRRKSRDASCCCSLTNPMLRLPAKCESPAPSPSPQRSLPLAQPPAPRPILRLVSAQQTLYVELIQSSTLSGQVEPMVWVRPLLLTGDPVVDLQHHTADLLWPARAFAPAYAEDLLPLLEQALTSPNPRPILQRFMTQVWKEQRAS